MIKIMTKEQLDKMQNKQMQNKYFEDYRYIETAIRQDSLQHITVETGDKNIYIPQESKFIVTKDFLVDKTSVFGFLYNHSMKSIDFTNFDFSEITTMKHWFAHNYNLKTVTFPKKMNMPKLNNLEAIFASCELLKEVDLSWIVTDSQVNLTNAFLYCDNLENLTLPKITITRLDNIAQDSYKLQKVILPIKLIIDESFTIPSDMFKNCVKLKMIDMSEAKLVNNDSTSILNLQDLLESNDNTYKVHKDCIVLLQ